MLAEPWKDLWQCCTPTGGLDLSPSMKRPVQPPQNASSVSSLYNAPANLDGRDASIIERMKSCSSASCVSTALRSADVRVSASPEAQQRVATIVAGRQSDEDKDKRTALERTCPSNLEGVYVYIALVAKLDEDFFGTFPDVPINGALAPTIEDLKQKLKERLLMYAEEVVLGNFPVPPARFNTLDDYEEVEGEPMPDEELPEEPSSSCKFVTRGSVFAAHRPLSGRTSSALSDTHTRQPLSPPNENHPMHLVSRVRSSLLEQG
ncbi:g1713 [Coccomyxa elongata]